MLDKDKKKNSVLKDPYQQQQQEYDRGRLGRLGSLIGGVAGSLIPIPGVGTMVGAGLGSLLGNAGGQLLSGGQFNPIDMVTSGVTGAAGGAIGGAIGPAIGGTAGQIVGQGVGNLGGQQMINGPIQQPQPNPYEWRPGMGPAPYGPVFRR